jgi:hypothetical protein
LRLGPGTEIINGYVDAATWTARHNQLVPRFGIEDYEPRWLNGRDAITTAHGPRIAALTGHTLRHVWLVWDLDVDGWFTDAPVVFDFGVDRIGVDHQKFDDLSITWNTPDPTRRIDDPDFHLAWRPEPLPELARLPGQHLQRVELLEWVGNDMANGSVAIGFTFAGSQLTIFNALDENGFEYTPPGPGYRRHPLLP